jgi:hypothetical protein
MSTNDRFFHAAGYVFTYSAQSRKGSVRIEMWREDPNTRERFWVTTAMCAPDRKAAYSAAMALVAWVRSLDVHPRASLQAQAVCESLAIMNDRLARARATRSDPALSVALDRLIEGKAAAA